ncbi:MAG: dTDP-4-dehydrorhamnose 3,5-epimerase [Phycisphaerales bacterium]|nr:MAG: dTDP-4-dehydrorhamnose 3,5-epimerase [Phycisphaerales bacterium]
MEIEKTKIDGLLVLKPDVYSDARGYFLEQYSKKRYGELGSFPEFVQDNCSFSCYGTVRGLHYQIGASAQGKLVYVIYGKVLDVAVDVRFGSPTFGQYVAVELSHENKLQFWLPAGFAHGFSVLSETATFYYKCTAYYDRDCERSIRFDDPDLNIDWKVSNPIVSHKDQAAPSFRSIARDFVFAGERERV